ncbi:MAG TPA: hypothetical protein VGV18_04030 [Verrucomicrobiae bacterium]|nr:hypothetical protein [Verrucomicrobiae bacterium]
MKLIETNSDGFLVNDDTLLARFFRALADKGGVGGPGDGETELIILNPKGGFKVQYGRLRLKP